MSLQNDVLVVRYCVLCFAGLGGEGNHWLPSNPGNLELLGFLSDSAFVEAACAGTAEEDSVCFESSPLLEAEVVILTDGGRKSPRTVNYTKKNS